MYEIRRYTEINSLGGATVLDAAINTPAVRDRLRKMVVASSMSIYGEGACRCSVHGLVLPRNPDGGAAGAQVVGAALPGRWLRAGDRAGADDRVTSP